MSKEMESFNNQLFDELALEELERRLEMAQLPLLAGGGPPPAQADHNGAPFNFPGQHCAFHGGVHDCQAHNSCLGHGLHSCVPHGGHTCVGHGSHCDAHGHGWDWPCVAHGGHNCLGHDGHVAVWPHGSHCDVHAITCVEHGMSCVAHGSFIDPAPRNHTHSDAH